MAVNVHAPRPRVRAIVDDMTLIPQYHPQVGKVDLLPGRSTRAAGVKYRCTGLEGRKGSCVEGVETVLVQHGPNETIVVLMPTTIRSGRKRNC